MTRLSISDRDDDGCVVAFLVLENQHVRVAVGNRVVLRDDEGNASDGSVVDVSADAVKVAPVWETWRSEPLLHVYRAYEPRPEFLADLLSAARSVPAPVLTAGTETLTEPE